MKYIFAMLLMCSPALADANLIYASFGTAVAGPDPIVYMMPMRADENRNIAMYALATDPAGIKSITLIGNGKTLITCVADICNFTWLRTKMISGKNTIIIRVVNLAGVSRDAPGYVNKPN